MDIKPGDLFRFKNKDGKVVTCIIAQYFDNFYGGTITLVWPDWRISTHHLAFFWDLEPEIVGRCVNPLSKENTYMDNLDFYGHARKLQVDKPQGKSYTVVDNSVTVVPKFNSSNKPIMSEEQQKKLADGY